MSTDTQTNRKNRLTDVILELKPREGGAYAGSKTGTGLVDARLFTGTNKLHAIMDTQVCHWYLKYDDGVLPQALKQRFTGWSPLIKFVTEYFNKRNIDIIEIKD